MKAKYGSFDGLDTKAKVMLTIWELTKNDGRKFASPEEIAARLNVRPGYIRKVIGEIEEELPAPHLSPDKYHARGVTKGRKRIRYRLHDDAVIKEGTALILLELLKSHRPHSADREEFIDRMVKEYGMKAESVEDRIKEGIRAGYIEDLTSFDDSIRGRERINKYMDYIKALASKYRSTPLRQQSSKPGAKGKAGKSSKGVKKH
jgi:DNA-binding MarR family transcriptional regulator